MVGKRYCELPILGSILSAMGCIPLAEFGSANAYRSGVEVLRKGHCLAIFPEGQRTRDGSLSRLRSGAARWALSTGAPIVPVSIVGAHEAWPLGRRLPRVRRPIIVKFHRPIRCELVDGESLKEGATIITTEIDRVLRRRLGAWQRLKDRKLHPEASRV